jgi:hypothetical protein
LNICAARHVEGEFNGVLLLAETALADRIDASVNVSEETFSTDMEVSHAHRCMRSPTIRGDPRPRSFDRT